LTRTNTASFTKKKQTINLHSEAIQATNATSRAMPPIMDSVEENQTMGIIMLLRLVMMMSRHLMSAKIDVITTHHALPSTCNIRDSSARHIRRIPRLHITVKQFPHVSSREG
jgi:hypothetical protein